MFVIDVVINGTETIGTDYECCGEKPIATILVSWFKDAIVRSPTLRTDLDEGAHA